MQSNVFYGIFDFECREFAGRKDKSGHRSRGELKRTNKISKLQGPEGTNRAQPEVSTLSLIDKCGLNLVVDPAHCFPHGGITEVTLFDRSES